MFFTVFKTFFSQFFTVSHIFPLFFFTIFTICHRFFTAYNSFHCCSLIVTAQPSLHGLVWYQYYYLHVLRYLVSPAYSICFGWIIGAINIRVDEFVVQIKPQSLGEQAFCIINDRRASPIEEDYSYTACTISNTLLQKT